MAAKQRLLKKAQEYLVGGVSSPVRAFKAIGIDPVYINKGRGAEVFTCDGRKLIDYGLGWGSLLLGHADKDVVRAVQCAAGEGFYFGTTHPVEIELAEEILRAVRPLEKIRFTVSGTEAVMGALRVARGFTGRDIVVRFSNSYHGHADHLLAQAGSGMATMGIPVSKGVPREFLRHTATLPYNDREAIETFFAHRGKNIAAVIVEPVGGNFGVCPPDMEFLSLLRKVTRKHGALLVADEVITGFRFNYGSFMLKEGIEPDLICFGKVIGGGLPIGAYVGRAKIMSLLAPTGDVYQASTFSGHPLSMTAGLATLKKLRSLKQGYQRISQQAESLCSGLEQLAFLMGVRVSIRRHGSMFSIHFNDNDQYRIFYRSMLEGGVYLAPSQFEANFVSFAHEQEHICRTIMTAAKPFMRCLE